MFFVSTFYRMWRWRKQFSHEQPFEQRLPEQEEVSTIEEMRSREHHSIAVSELQKVKRNYFLERPALM